MEKRNRKIEKRPNTIRSFKDLDVYKPLYKAMLIVHREILPKIPAEEKYDLQDQVRRASKAPLGMIAEGFSKRYQARSWKKYLEDAMGEANEMINHLNICAALYSKCVKKELCEELIEMYDVSSRQLYSLRLSWKIFTGGMVINSSFSFLISLPVSTFC